MRTSIGDIVTCFKVTGDFWRTFYSARNGTLMVWDITGGETVGGIVYLNKCEFTDIRILEFEMVTRYSVREEIVWWINGS